MIDGRLQVFTGNAHPQLAQEIMLIGIMEAVITPESELVGSSAGRLRLFDRHAINLLAVSRKGRRTAHRCAR